MPDLTCNSDCKFQKEGKCTLERADWAKSSDGAECMSHLFEKEDSCRF
ncbi:hypothetical protein [Dethiobacter alkaliphilus]|uniref:DUF1540 domain-containing protein n=1 Tax=Dethiobacter alkaliphilus AHT 1 TaxID=555088 RepID=C0GJ88_DETAL|nr:hypothetical protein [Dethiobacter alkaliphilus]EEG76573.1 hypothetical protein DealDRAFT_2547 [Dethiobacter alkaliphilus AHT 1]MCW3489078.1 hypothetical protein [Dethiobacter alkaliphilus]